MDRQPHDHWQFSLRDLFFLSFSIALGLSFWKMEQDWYVGVLAAVSFWVVLGLAAQIRDIWHAFRLDDHATADGRWGWRFALAWRLAVCSLIGVCFLIRLLVRFKVLAQNDGQDLVLVSSREMWAAVLLTSLIAAITGSLGLGRRGWRRPWLYVVYVFRGFAAGYLLLVALENLQLVPYLVHITIVAILSAQPLKFEPDVVFAASRTRIDLFYNIASAGAISILASCILLWELSVRWRSGWRQRAGLGVLLVTSLAIMILLTARIAVVEIPTISPIMTANFRVPAPLQLGAAAVLAVFLATAVARRWSEPPCAEAAAGSATWRRDKGRYHHERRVLIVSLGAIALAECIELAYALYGQLRVFGATDWADMLFLFTRPVASLSLALVLLAASVALSGWSKRPDAIATEQPRLTPALFLTVWFSLLAIIVCSAPILGSWHFASFLRSGFFPR